MSILYEKWGEGARAALKRVEEMVYPERALCRSCGVATDGGVLCAGCRERLQSDGFFFSWDREILADGETVAWALRPHEGIARQMVIRLKYQAEACVAEELAGLMEPVPAEVFLTPETVVTWVTMPASRRRERGIDHGRALAEAVAGRLGLECRQLLDRAERGGKRQVKLNGEQRMKNLKGAFSPREKMDFPVLLVDDVRTTGTTALRCAEALRKGGAERVTVLTITRR